MSRNILTRIKEYDLPLLAFSGMCNKQGALVVLLSSLFLVNQIIQSKVNWYYKWVHYQVHKIEMVIKSTLDSLLR